VVHCARKLAARVDLAEQGLRESCAPMHTGTGRAGREDGARLLGAVFTAAISTISTVATFTAAISMISTAATFTAATRWPATCCGGAPAWAR
jgi:hypothetical protein